MDSTRDESGTGHTAAAAQGFIQRQALWKHLLNIFHHNRPTEDDLSRVGTLAEVAIDQVFSAYRLTANEQQERHSAIKDYAECAALYGYVLGLHEGAQRAQYRAVAANTGD